MTNNNMMEVEEVVMNQGNDDVMYNGGCDDNKKDSEDNEVIVYSDEEKKDDKENYSEDNNAAMLLIYGSDEEKKDEIDLGVGRLIKHRQQQQQQKQQEEADIYTPFLTRCRETVNVDKDEIFARWFNERGQKSDERTWGSIWEESSCIAHYLRHELGIQKGECVVLCYVFGLHFLTVFLACLRAGITAVLVYPPHPLKLTDSLTKMNKVINDCAPKCILMDSMVKKIHSFDTSTFNFMSKSKTLWPQNILYVVSDKAKVNKNSHTSFDDVKTSPSDLAFLQYTSGSTGDPKGVMITFGSLAAQVDWIFKGFHKGARENGIPVPQRVVGFSWLPQYHDLGLVQCTLAPFAVGWQMQMMSPLAFLGNPLLWIDLMSQHKAQWTVAPDFAYRLVVRKFQEKLAKNPGEEPIPNLDLSSLKSVQNCAEPIRLSTREDFANVFLKYGLWENWFAASYGLAEHVVGVSWIWGLHISPVPSQQEEGNIEDLPENKLFVACGIRDNFQGVAKIVNTETYRELPDGQVGELWLAGPSVAKGYFKKDLLSKEVFDARLLAPKGSYNYYDKEFRGVSFLRTGDLAFFHQDKLFICGRLKDLIICNGVNYYPNDIEAVVQDAAPDAVRPGCVTAFSRNDSVDDGNVEVVFEIRKDYEKKVSEIIETIRCEIGSRIGLSPVRVVAIEERTIPKTTSGKIQRKNTRKQLHDDNLSIVYDWKQSKHGHHSAVREFNDENKENIETSTCGEISKANNGVVDGRKAAVKTAQTPEEIKLAEIWADILDLDVDEVDITANFFTLGGQSAQILELANRLEVSVAVLFQHPTIESFLNRSLEYEFPDAKSDIWLPPPAITETKEEEEVGTTPTKTHISLVTGANGLFGFHLLASLLDRTTKDHHFICLIRGKNDAQVREKFDQTIDYYGYREKLDMSRVTLMRGDFSLELLGLDQDQYDKLAETVEEIYHVGSHVNNWLPYECLRIVNVEGTRRLITLARTTRKKKFHYASTTTFTPDKEDQTVFLETDRILESRLNKYNGYDISKYVSEELCNLSREDGFDCNIYRLVWVGGHLETGLSKLNDGVNILLRILLTLGVYPKGYYVQDIIPVDLMADAVASVQSKASNTTFNVTSQSNESIDTQKVAAMLQGMGYKLKEISFENFMKALRSYPEDEWDEYCNSYRALLVRLYDDGIQAESLYDSSNMKKYLDDDIRKKLETKFLDEYVQKAVHYLVRNGAIPTPSGGNYLEDIERIDRWNHNPAPEFPLHKCVHQVFEGQVAKTPENIAVVMDDERWTYRKLNCRANQFAAFLQESGVKPGDYVGISLERSFDLYASIIGAMKAGATYVPLDPTYPPDVLAHIINDSAVKLVLTSTVTKAVTDGTDCPSLCIDEPDTAEALTRNTSDEIVFKLDAELDPRSLAYIMYTTGSTGKPKGVMIEHRGIVNHCYCMIEYFDLKPNDTVLQFITMNWDYFIEEVFPTFTCGAAISIIRDKDRMDVNKVRDTIKRTGVTLAKFPAAFWHRIAGESFNGLGLKRISIGGEEADIKKFRKWMEVNPTIPVINTYGPTEATVTASVAVLDSRHVDRERLPIGKPLKNTQIHILNDQMHVVPVGTIGNLYISGVQVGRGYLNQEEKTRKAFKNGEALGSSESLYFTGDKARWTPDGEIEFFGRCDNQVKVRGYRIELGAIESVLGEHERVDVAAVVLKKINDEKRIVAYFQSKEELEPAILRQHIRERLPPFMTPYAIIQMEKVFVGNNGKIDRSRLEKLEVCMKSLREKVSQPENELQRKMVEIWNDLLGIGHVGIDDDFLNLGGHSLLAISVLQRMNKELRANLSFDDFYANLTIRELSSRIEAPQTEDRGLTSMVEFNSKSDPDSEKLFLVHGVGGNLATYYPLIRQVEQILDKSRKFKVYGLQANAVPDRQLSSAKEMVEAYVDHITSVQKTGPYLLGGWSYGASVAFLIAQELIERGEQIAGYLSIDAEAPQSFPDFNEFLNENNIQSARELYDDKYLLMAIRRFGCHFGFADNGGLKERLNAFLGNTGAIRVKDKLHTFLGYPNAANNSERDMRNMLAVANLYNVRGFDPKSIAVEKALFIRATESKFDDYDKNWSQAINSSQATMEDVGGDHWSIMSEMETATHIAHFLKDINVGEMRKEPPTRGLDNSNVCVSKNAKKVAIIGSGVAGISASRVFASRGFDITTYEASDAVSGLWAKRYRYPEVGIQTPSKFYEFPDKKHTGARDDYKDGETISRYCEEYVKEYNLTKFIRLNTKVTAIDAADNDKWTVTSECGDATSSEVFDFVILATGLFAPGNKFIPEIEGMEHFEGSVYHSVDTAGISSRKGKKVVVVGFGKSAHDCAMTAAKETGVAPTLLFRNAYWCTPRKVLGFMKYESQSYPRFAQAKVPGWKDYGPVEYLALIILFPIVWLFWRVVELIYILQMGLYGEHSHLRPTVSFEEFMLFGHATICHPDMFPMMRRKEILPVKGSIKRILQNGKIQLDNGSELEADEIIFATGYRRELSFLPKELIAKKEEDGFFAYRNMLVPGVPNIAFLNNNILTVNGIATPAIQSVWLAELLQGNFKLPANTGSIVEKDKKWRRKNLKRAGGDRSIFIPSLHTTRYYDSLLSDMGAEVRRKKFGARRILGVFQNMFECVYPSDYQSIISGEWKNDPRQVHWPGYKPSYWLEWCVLCLLAFAATRSAFYFIYMLGLCLILQTVGLCYEHMRYKGSSKGKC